MTAKKYILALFAIALIVSVFSFAYADETGEQDANVSVVDDESNSSTIDQKFADQTSEFYNTMLDFFYKNQDSNMSTVVFAVPEDTNSTDGDSNATTNDVNSTFELELISIGDYDFYFGLNEEGYYFGDVNGSVYFIRNEDLPMPVSVHLSNLLPTMEKIQNALEEGNSGQAFGLLTSLKVRIAASERFLENYREREQKMLEIQDNKQNNFNERAGRSNAPNIERGPNNNSIKEEKSNNRSGNSGNSNR